MRKRMALPSAMAFAAQATRTPGDGTDAQFFSLCLANDFDKSQ
jgi:hypothetical protein